MLNKEYVVEVLDRFKSVNDISQLRELADPRFQFHEGTLDHTCSLDGFCKLISWDNALQTDLNFFNYTVEDNKVMVDFHKTNKLSQLLDYPGWQGKMIFWFTDTYHIQRLMVVFDSKPIHSFFKFREAFEWLKDRFPQHIDFFFKNNEFNYSSKAALELIRMLRIWRKETKRSKVSSVA